MRICKYYTVLRLKHKYVAFLVRRTVFSTTVCTKIIITYYAEYFNRAIKIILNCHAYCAAHLSPAAPSATGWKVPCENSPASAGWNLPLRTYPRYAPIPVCVFRKRLEGATRELPRFSGQEFTEKFFANGGRCHARIPRLQPDGIYRCAPIPGCALSKTAGAPAKCHARIPAAA
jgi:hypothetical protein